MPLKSAEDMVADTISIRRFSGSRRDLPDESFPIDAK